MKRLSVLIGLSMILAYGGLATAADSGPYLVGHWKLNDRFSDFGNPESGPIKTKNTEFVFLNPTSLTLQLEYAFFDSDGTFCGCDHDTLQPNGRVRYTMLGELQGGQFSRTKCPGTGANPQTDGAMKTIVFMSANSDSVNVGNAVQAGYQIDVFGEEGRTEADLKAVVLNQNTQNEINSIHGLCAGFTPVPPAK